MATWNDLIDNVGDELALDTYKSGGADVTRTQRALNRTLQQIFSSYPFSWRVLETPLSITPVVGQTDYDLSAGVGGKKFQDIFSAFADTNSSSSRPLTEKTLKWYIDHFANVASSSAATPKWYARVGQYTVRVAPKPANITDILKFYITEEFADLTIFTGAITIPTDMQGVVEDGMLSKMYRFLHEFEIANELKRDFATGVQKLVTEDGDNPNLSFEMEGASFGSNHVGDYWKSPFA